VALTGQMAKKSAGAVRNEEASHNGPGVAHGGNTDSVLDKREAEAQHCET
jgi:hypothetical protein